MSLKAGTRIGAYEVVSALGAGGMGEVYRARITTLNRDVAIKIVPEAFASDPDRLMRFEREAQTLAALNHPNIAQIHGLEESGLTRALVMELVEGEDLSERIRSGAGGRESGAGIPLDEALRIAQQIAAALEAAHDTGIVHRDLKPANIKVRADGTVKVLDFGLAKALDQGSGIGDQGSGDLANLPTITSPAMTMAGVILGTAAYMSPEQAKGQPVDRRADVWAFGAVLYEMLARKLAFGGDSIIEVLGGVVKSDPDWRALPANLSPSILSVLRRCLEKNPDRRLRDIREARQLLEQSANEPDVVVRQPSGGFAMSFAGRAMIGAGAIAALGAGFAAGIFSRSADSPADEIRFEIPAESRGVGYPQVAISPDGRHIVYAGRTPGGSALLVHTLSTSAERVLAGTESGAAPVFSPDSRWIAFGRGNRLMKIEVAGGPALTLADEITGRCAWSPLKFLICSHTSGRLVRVPEGGGSAAPLLELDTAAGETGQSFPSMLPDGRRFLFLSRRSGYGGAMGQEIRVGSIDSETPTSLMPSESMAFYAAPGFVLFLRNQILLAAPFDATRRQLSGEPIAIAENVFQNALGRAAFDTSSTGIIVYRTSADYAGLHLNWVDRGGSKLQAISDVSQPVGPALSPNQKRVAFHRLIGAGGDIWVADSGTGQTSRVTFDPSQQNGTPVWSPDGSRIAFRSRRNNLWGIYEKAANGLGAERLLTESPLNKSATSWSADGRLLAFTVIDPGTDVDVWVYSFEDRKAFPVLREKYRERDPQFSPDGRWLSYASDETGTSQIYVQSFPAGRAKWQVSIDRGDFARWRDDGREIFYTRRVGPDAPTVRFLSSTVTVAGDALVFSKPNPVFDTPLVTGVPGFAGNFMPWTMTSDARRFVLMQPAGNEPEAPSNLKVVVNWRGLPPGTR